MATIRQIEANRANALKSTGPRTEAGKSSSSGNALTHGLSAKRVVIEGEDPSLFDSLRDQLIAEFTPQGAAEELLVEQMASSLWRLRRVPHLEASLLDWITYQEQERDDVATILEPRTVPPFGRYDPVAGAPADREGYQVQDGLLVGRMIEAALARGDLLSKLTRYEAQIMKQLDKSIERLRLLQSRRLAGGGHDNPPS